jgi:hypothetical protein
LIDWKEIFEHPSAKRNYMKDQSDKHNYLSQHAFLYNCMWKFYPDGTIFYNEGFDVFDQFIISKGLLNGEQGLKMNLNEVKIDKFTRMANHIFSGVFEPMGNDKIHPVYKESPMRFEYKKIKSDGEPDKLPQGREPLTGYSDHFPIQSSIDILG